MKSIFASKTFWLNLLGFATAYAEILPPKYGLPVLAGANIVNRFLTTTGVSITGK